MKDFKRQIIETNDGSSSLLIPELNETYHSTKGAKSESQFIYIDRGLALVPNKSKTINILEIGMGTGLNVLLSYQYALANELTLNFTTLEPYPIDIRIINKLNYIKGLNTDEREFFNEIHGVSFDETVEMHEQFQFKKLKVKLEDFNPELNEFDVVYFDAFAPSKQAEIWNIELLKKVQDSMKPKGILTTYCAQGQFKRNLIALGFKVENPEGPMGKKEMTIAYK